MSVITTLGSAQVRNWLYSLIAPAQAVLVGWGVIDNATAQLWAALAISLLGLGIAGANATDTARRWVYGLLAPIQALLVGYGIFTDSQVTPVIALVVVALGLGLAGVHSGLGAEGTEEPVLAGKHEAA